MTQKELEILTKAVAIAKRNGFEIADTFFTDIQVEDSLLEDGDKYMNIIFNHSFARSFWGEGLIQIASDSDRLDQEEPYEVDLVETAEIGSYPIAGLISCDNTIQLPMWQYHLGQMVYRKKPIDYIGEAIAGALDEEDEPMQ